MDSLIDRYVDANTADIRKRLLPAALKVLHRHRRRGDRVLVATGAPPELARAILDFVAHEGLPVIGSLGKPFLGGFITDQHCHAANKMRMIHAAGYGEIAIAYSDSRRALPLLHAATHSVGVNPPESARDGLRRALPPRTPAPPAGCAGPAGQPAPPPRSPAAPG